MDPTPQQAAAIDDVMEWIRTPGAPQIFRLFGYAGTGKTTIAKHIAQLVGGRVIFAAYTGKAALVLRSKGCLPSSTIHSLIYKVEDTPPCPICRGLGKDSEGVKCAPCKGSGDGPDGGKPTFRLNPESPVYGARLVIVDECSMVGDELGNDLLSFGARILVLGDPAQLPPVQDAGFFTDAEPDFMLTDIRRQALDNPIVRMSLDVREGRGIQIGTYGESKVIKRADLQPGEVMAADQVLCGMNNTRRGLNIRFRQQLGLDQSSPDHPAAGDRLVCLKNDRLRQLYNGSLWTAEKAELKNRDVLMNVKSADDGGPSAPVKVIVPIEYFYGTEKTLDRWRKRSLDAFDFGYALTVHKSQGSQWPHVMVFDESHVFRENQARHLYTAITRAADRVTVVV